MGEKTPKKAAKSAAVANGGETKKKKKGIFKIKGLFRGRTKKKEKAANAESSKSVASTNADDETTSLHPIETKKEDAPAPGAVGASPALAGFDPAMLDIPEEEGDDALEYGEKTASGAPKDNIICLQIVLLLMDPKTRRFELLQLEFDSDKARVSDILAQVPLSVTEETIREQKYEGVCDRLSKDHGANDKLVEFCHNKDVLVAIPEGLPAEEISRLARPILGDEKVIAMLQTCGIDTTPWRSSKQEDKPKKSNSRELPEIAQRPAAKRGKRSFFPMFVVLCALLAIVVQTMHNYVSSPVSIGRPVAPGTWRSKCGLYGIFSGCENSFMQVNVDGSVNFYDAEQDLVGTMTGSLCDEEDDCIEGLLMLEDGSLVISGKPVSYLTSYSDELDVTPWPFLEAPKVKTYRARVKPSH